MKANIKILKAECHAAGVHLVTTRRALHIHYRDFAFTPEIREHGRAKRHAPIPLTAAPINNIAACGNFVLTRTK